MASLDMNINITSDLPLIAQPVTCYYPTSDIWSPTPRYLYYILLVLSFITPRHTWLAHIFFGGAVAYAATAAIEAFILLSAQLGAPPAQNVTIPYIDSANLSLTPLLGSITSLVTDTDVVAIQPDYLELDIDSITCVVVAAYLVGLPLQCWSSTARTSRILHLLIFIWNVLMLAGSVSVLVLWPGLNVAKPQYRFCYAGIDDGVSLQNPGWLDDVWAGSWNASVWNLFRPEEADLRRWLNYSSTCFYPCFNTSEIMREPTSLKASVFGADKDGDNLHSWSAYQRDDFQPLIYSAIIVFTLAQLYLLAIGRLKLCTDRVPIYRPLQFWVRRRETYHSFMTDLKSGCHVLVECLKHAWNRGGSRERSSTLPLSFIAGGSTIQPHGPSSSTKPAGSISLNRHPGADAEEQTSSSPSPPPPPPPPPATTQKHRLFSFLIDLFTLCVLLSVMILGPLTIIVFIIWIEQYIRYDGAPREGIEAVGQWAFIVQIGIVLVAVLTIRLRYRVASEDEIQRDIERAKCHLGELESIAERKRERKRKQNAGLARAAKKTEKTRADARKS